MSFRSRVPGNEGQLVRNDVGRWRSLDPESTGWALANPDSVALLTSIVISDVGIRMVLDKDEKAKRFDSGNQHGPRFWKQLIGPNGPLLWSDRFTVEFLAVRTATDANSGEDGAGFTVGISDGTVITDVSDVEWVGMMFNNLDSDGSIRAQIGGDSSASAMQAATGVAAYCVIVPPCAEADDDIVVSRVAGYLLSSSGQTVATTASGNQAHPYADGANVNLFFAPAYRSSVATADPDNTYKVWYRVNYMPGGFAPAAYIPGEGFSIG
jgi:hypothetical protein